MSLYASSPSTSRIARPATAAGGDAEPLLVHAVGEAKDAILIDVGNERGHGIGNQPHLRGTLERPLGAFSRGAHGQPLRTCAALHLAHDHGRERADQQEKRDMRRPLPRRSVVRPGREPECGSDRRQHCGQQRRPAATQIGANKHRQHERQQGRLRAQRWGEHGAHRHRGRDHQDRGEVAQWPGLVRNQRADISRRAGLGDAHE